MKCLNREDIQLLLDNELASEQKTAFLVHISECANCHSLHEQALKEKALLSEFFKSYDELLVGKHITAFPYPKRQIPIFLKIAVSFVLIFSLGFLSVMYLKEDAPLSSENSRKAIVTENLFPLEELDLNQQWQARPITATVFDKNGNIIYEF